MRTDIADDGFSRSKRPNSKTQFYSPVKKWVGRLAVEKTDDFLDVILAEPVSEIILGDLRGIVVDPDVDDLQPADILLEKLQQRGVLDRSVQLTEDEDMRPILEATGAAMAEDNPGGFKKGPGFHMTEECIDPFRRIITVPVENAMEKAMVPDFS